MSDKKCYLCGAEIEFPADDDPQFIDDDVVTSKCRHYILVRHDKPITPPITERKKA